jgi:hypothetical protein
VPIIPLFSTRFNSATLEAILSLSWFICLFNFSPTVLSIAEDDADGVVAASEGEALVGTALVGVGVKAKAVDMLSENVSASDIVINNNFFICYFLKVFC